ncbi:unnamed protein product [Diatraea saccharalis]|uniref:Peptidase S8 pro-domain domain-containing protein n=1 Tax=Diatraea saccharalis TaxID=40085 RepID=A0A9N9R3X7_9NEOP|nr:unnamed protein product [Diatraea saccharalis]
MSNVINRKVLGSETEWHFAHRGLPHARTRRSIAHTRMLKQHPLVHTAVQQTGFKRVKRGFRPLRLPETAPAAEPRDPYFPLQWYLKNTGQNGGKPKLDLNVEAAWAQGYTGVNVTTAIMDDEFHLGLNYKIPGAGPRERVVRRVLHGRLTALDRRPLQWESPVSVGL